MAKRLKKVVGRPTLEECGDLISALEEWRDAGGTTMEIIYCLRVFVDSMIDSYPHGSERAKGVE